MTNVAPNQLTLVPLDGPPSTPQPMHRSAVISPCKMYRYLLRRAWDESLPTALFVMLNPSTADAEVDDPTIRRCMGFARSWGMGSIEVVNRLLRRVEFGPLDEQAVMRVVRRELGPDWRGPEPMTTEPDRFMGMTRGSRTLAEVYAMVADVRRRTVT